MAEDETKGGGGRSFEGPDPEFIRRLEDDTLWSSVEPRRAREAEGGDTPRSSRAAAAERRRADRRKARQLRRITVIILVVAAIMIALVGLQIKDSEFGSSTGKSTPFSLLPLESITTSTTTTTAAPPTSSTTTSLPSPSSTPSATTPVAAVVVR